MSNEFFKDLFQPGPRRRLSESVEQSVQESLAASPPKPTGDSVLGGSIPGRLIPDEKRWVGVAIGGAPAWAVRLKRIETLSEKILAELAKDWREMALKLSSQPGRFEEAWRQRIEAVELGLLNELIRRHNRYFPAEAGLPMSPRTGDYIGWGGRDWRRTAVSNDDLAAIFPADLELALSGGTGQLTWEALFDASDRRPSRQPGQ